MNLEYTLVGNTKPIEHAFRRLDAMALQSNRKIEAMFAKLGIPKGGPGSSSSTEKSHTNETEKGSRERVKSKEREERDKTRATERGERERLRLAEKTSREEARVKERWNAYNEKLKDQHARSNERKIREESRIQERWHAYNSKLRDQHARAGVQTERAARQAEQSALMDYARKRQRYTGVVGGMIGNTSRAVMGAGRAAIAMTSLGGGALVAAGLSGVMGAEKSAAGLANQMAKEGTSTEDIIESRKAILKNASGVKGFSAVEALDAQRTFGGKAGDYALGGKMLQRFSKVSLATDVSINDVADVAANVFMKLKSENPGQSQGALLEQVMEAVQAFAGQGNVGSVEMKDLAMYAGRLTASAPKFKGSRVENMKDMGALAQIAIGTGSATSAETATQAASKFAEDLTKHTEFQKKIGLTGKDLYADYSAKPGEGNTKFNSIESIITKMMTKTGGALPAMTKLVGEETRKMMEGISIVYNDAEAKNKALPKDRQRKKGEAGTAAIHSEFEMFRAATVKTEDLESRAEAALSTTSAQLEENMRQLTSQVGMKLLPALNDAIPAIARMTPTIVNAAEAAVKFVEGFSKLSIGEKIWYVIGAAMLKEIAVWGIGAAGKAALEFAIGSILKIVSPALPGVPGAATTLGGAAAPGATSALGGAVAGAGLATVAAVGAMGVIAGGSILALGYQQGERKDEQMSRGTSTVEKLKEKLGDTGGLYGMALAEEEANAALKKQFRRSVEAGGGTQQFEEYSSKRSEVKSAADAAFAKGNEQLTAALNGLQRALENADFSTSTGVSPNRSGAPSWLLP